jgi:hypothetical protein
MVPSSGGAPAFFFAIGLLLAIGCGGAPGPSRPDPAVQAIAGADARLRGAWRLVRFDPVEPLEPMLQQLLLAFQASAVARFDGAQLVADAPGIHLVRRYQIREAQGDRFTIVSFDDQGVAYVSKCDFGPGGQLVVYSESDPWRGTATLQRAAPQGAPGL